MWEEWGSIDVVLLYRKEGMASYPCRELQHRQLGAEPADTLLVGDRDNWAAK
ncbi:hypothetical protein BT69DRAFT_1280443 [Atractiella rhizophila]|nr:hypothetical protein BT69DRAFT_1291444 [Atractiella rhizophila]KAH8924564.1 hypothetical protein BT69DRAFT_1280443 [Atractiella rhizophila]